MTPRDAAKQILLVLEIAKGHLKEPGVNVDWSSYSSPEEAASDIEAHISRLKEHDYSKIFELKVLFAPTGNLQDISISSGWGDEFLRLAERFDTYASALE